MQILIFIYAFEAGGAQRRAIALANAFHDAGHEVAVAVVHNDGELKRDLAAGIAVHALGSLFPRFLPGKSKRATRLLGTIHRLARLVKQENPDILLAGANHVILCSLIAKRLAGKRHEATRLVLRFSNTLSGDHKQHSLTRPVKIAILRRLVHRASALIAVSQDVAKDVAKRLKIERDRLEVLPNPVIDAGFYHDCNQDPDHEWLRSGDVPVILGVGRLHEQKDFATLINAFVVLRQTMNARLIIYGEGTQRQTLQALAQAGDYSDAIDLPGYHANPWREMRHASVLVLPSCWEGMPGVLIEAMAAGCPVISTDCPGGSREILQDGRLGPLVPVGDAGAMAQAMEDVIAMPVDRAALKDAAAQYDVAASAQAYLDVFNRVCGPASDSDA